MDREIKRAIRHSKYKNTGLLFELLVRQITSDALNEKGDSFAMRLVKKYFNKDKPLSRELRLYKILLETKFSSESKARELIEETMDARGRLSNTSLRKEKYNLIKEISENYNVDEFFKNKLTNYKELASVYKLFEVETGAGKLPPDEKVQCRHTLIEKIVSKSSTPLLAESDTVFEEYRKQSEDLKKLAYKMMIEKFNQKYQSLDSRQKGLLREYIYNSADVSAFRVFVNTQIDQIKTELGENIKKISDKGTAIKVQGVLENLDKLKQDKGSVKDEHLSQILQYFELAKEVKRVVSKEKVNG